MCCVVRPPCRCPCGSAADGAAAAGGACRHSSGSAVFRTGHAAAAMLPLTLYSWRSGTRPELPPPLQLPGRGMADAAGLDEYCQLMRRGSGGGDHAAGQAVPPIKQAAHFSCTRMDQRWQTSAGAAGGGGGSGGAAEASTG